MTKRRSKLEIMLEILEKIHKGESKPTRIMYATNMSYKPMRKVLTSLVQQGLVAERDNPNSRRETKKYYITNKGIEVLRHFNLVDDLMGEVE